MSATRFAQLTGVSRERLRTWERRYGFPAPRRVAQGPRRYAVEDVRPRRRRPPRRRGRRPARRGDRADDRRARGSAARGRHARRRSSTSAGARWSRSRAPRRSASSTSTRRCARSPTRPGPGDELTEARPRLRRDAVRERAAAAVRHRGRRRRGPPSRVGRAHALRRAVGAVPRSRPRRAPRRWSRWSASRATASGPRERRSPPSARELEGLRHRTRATPAGLETVALLAGAIQAEPEPSAALARGPRRDRPPDRRRRRRAWPSTAAAASCSTARCAGCSARAR